EGATLGDLVMMLLFGLLPFALGTYWVTQVLKAHRKEAWEALEREVLSYAMRKGGVVTALEIAAHTNLSYDEVKRYLDGLADKGHIEVTPTDNGLAYRFPGADTNPGAPLWSPPSTEAPHLPNRTSE
ncbi:MAG TPA: FaeA/PapI family transcriptional regulator, partial [Armatimonadota bacterium]|nr:FaeA/PapI family transcriptional regulator [Armatimonadota bacterium]